MRNRGVALCVLLFGAGCASGGEPVVAALEPLSEGLSDACVLAPSAGACCAAGQVIEDGTAAPDAFVHDAGDAIARCTLGRASRDLVRAGSGADHVLMGPDADFAEGREGADRIAGNDGNDELRGDGGDDWIDGGSGRDLLAGGRGADTVRGGPGPDRIAGDADDDRLRGDAGDDVIAGGPGDDWILAGEGRDQVDGGEGDDVIVAYDVCELVAGETVLGGPGVDRFYSPLSRERLAALGIVVEVETFVVIPSSCLSSCGACAPPSATDHALACSAACVGAVACTTIDGLDAPDVAECQAACAQTPEPPAGCDARTVLDAQLRCLTGTCAELFDCEVPSCE